MACWHMAIRVMSRALALIDQSDKGHVLGRDQGHDQYRGQGWACGWRVRVRARVRYPFVRSRSHWASNPGASGSG